MTSPAAERWSSRAAGFQGWFAAAARPLTAFLCCLLFVSSNCRRAGGVPRDPFDEKAEQALVAYLKIDTTNPPGNETPGAEFLRDLLTKEGIEARLVGDDPKRRGVWAKLDAPGTTDTLLLLSHIDVVPAVASSWTKPPFAGVRDGGYVWGRGALDIKSLTVAQAMAMIELKQRGAALRRDVVLLAVPDEELGGVHGTRALLEKHPQLFEGVRWVLNEGGSNETAVDRVIAWGVEVQQKVPLWLRLSSEALGGHAATPPEGGGAPAKLVRALAAVEAIETPYRLEASVARAAAAAVALRRDGRGQRMRLLAEPLDVKRIERELPPGVRALLRDTVAVTHLSAGSSVNVIPNTATALVDIRLLPDELPGPMLERVRKAAAPHASVEVLLESRPVPESPSDGELFQTLARAMRESAPGSAVTPVVGAGTTDSRYFRERGIAAYGVSPFKVNYYDADGVHGNDERIRVRFFHEGVRLMRRIVRDFAAK